MSTTYLQLCFTLQHTIGENNTSYYHHMELYVEIWDPLLPQRQLGLANPAKLSKKGVFNAFLPYPHQQQALASKHLQLRVQNNSHTPVSLCLS